MRLGTIRRPNGTTAVRVDGDVAVEVGAGDLGALLADPAWYARASDATGPSLPVDQVSFAPLVPVPRKIVCVGLNYADHIAEMGNEPPQFPTLFAKFASSLVGAFDDIVLPAVSDKVDWEAELAVVIGAPVRHVSGADAEAAIAGYTVLNDISVRDYQRRTAQWLQGKTFDSSTPVGPWMVTRDESPGPSRRITCEVNGELMQDSDTDQLVFDPVALVSYVSTICALDPGDLISTGTPGGVGAGRDPQQFLDDGDQVVTRIAGVGECRNRARAERLG